MRPVTWSQASVSVNDLSPAQSVMPVFPARATWMSATRGAAARVSARGPGWPLQNVPRGRGPAVLLSVGNPAGRLRYTVDPLGEKPKKKKSHEMTLVFFPLIKSWKMAI